MVVTFNRVTVTFPLVDVTSVEVSVVEDIVVVSTVTWISVTETSLASSERGTTTGPPVVGMVTYATSG